MSQDMAWFLNSCVLRYVFESKCVSIQTCSFSCLPWIHGTTPSDHSEKWELYSTPPAPSHPVHTKTKQGPLLTLTDSANVDGWFHMFPKVKFQLPKWDYTGDVNSLLFWSIKNDKSVVQENITLAAGTECPCQKPPCRASLNTWQTFPLNLCNLRKGNFQAKVFCQTHSSAPFKDSLGKCYWSWFRSFLCLWKEAIANVNGCVCVCVHTHVCMCSQVHLV